MSKRKMMRFERGVPVGQLINEDYMNNHDEWKGVVYQTNDMGERDKSLLMLLLTEAGERKETIIHTHKFLKECCYVL